MFLHRILGKHFRHPRGIFGRWAVHFMEKNNQDYYDKVVQQVNINDEDRILEIGFGSGLVIKRITEQNCQCLIEGIDFSKLMLKRAYKNNYQAILNQQVNLLHADFLDYDFKGKNYTKIIGINVIYFWDDLARVFTKLKRLLVKSGCLFLFMSSPGRLNQIPFAVDGVFNKYPVEKVLDRLQEAGFRRNHKEVILKKGQETYYFCAEK